METGKHETRIVFGGSVKAVGNGVVEGYLVPFTDANTKDLDGEYFDANTDLYVDKGYDVNGMRTLYHHGLDKTVGARAIGKITKARTDDFGVWVQAQLDLRDEYEQMIYRLAEDGKLGWSSGALPQSVQVDKSGHIKSWAVIEASLTPTPAMPLKTQINTVKSLIELYNDSREQEAREPSASANDANESRNDEFLNAQHGQIVNEERGHKSTQALGAVKMEALLEALQQLIAEFTEASGDDATAMADEIEEEAKADIEAESEKMDGMDDEDAKAVALQKSIARLEARFPAYVEGAIKRYYEKQESRKRTIAKAREAVERNAPARESVKHSVGVPQNSPREGGSRVSVGEDRRYASFDARDMMMAVKLAEAELSQKGYRNINMGQIIDHGILDEGFIRTALHRAAKYANSEPYKNQKANQSLKASLPIKADEINASDITGQGSEWAGEQWATDLWYAARYPRVYSTLVEKGAMVREIPQGSASVYIPTEGSDPTVYNTQQANDLSSNRLPVATQISAFGTGQRQVTPGEMRAAVAITDILAEDSVINVAQHANYVLTQAFEEYLDRVIINGDTVVTATGNINSDDADPDSGTGILDRPYYLTTDGLRKLPLVTNTANSRDAGATLTINDYRQTRSLLDGELRNRFNNLLYIIPPDVEDASLSIPEIATDDVRRSAATITSGRLLNVYGIDVFNSGFFPLAEADGKVSSTPSNNTLGSILLVYAPYWAFVFKRQLTMEMEREGLAGATKYIASMRIGVSYRSTNAAAISYNVGV